MPERAPTQKPRRPGPGSGYVGHENTEADKIMQAVETAMTDHKEAETYASV